MTSALIGRQHELTQLAQALDGLAEGGARAVLLTGEPGIGKTALLSALTAMARERGLAIASASGSERHWSPPFAAWTSIRAQLVDEMSIIYPAGGSEMDREEYLYRMRQEVISDICRSARHRPVLITLDDVQWLDALSRNLLPEVIRGLGDAPVLLAGTWRTPTSDADAAVVADLHREPRLEWLPVQALAENDVAVLGQRFGWSGTTTEVRRLTARTRGNPFFVTEIARLGEAPAGEVPASIHHLVGLRFNALPEPVRQVLGVAAIRTQAFDIAFLQAMTGLADDDLLDTIDIATAHDFLRPVVDRPDHHDFTHQIVREAIASTWSASRLVRLHRRSAEVLDGRIEESIASDLALHYHASRSLPGAERGVKPALAAAERALAAFAFDDAARFLDIAADLATSESMPVRADIAWRRAFALAEALRIDDAVTSADQAIDLLLASGAPADTVAHACWRMAHTLNAVGAEVSVRNRLRETGLAALGDRRDLAWARLRLLGDPIAVVPHPAIHVAKWVGYDADAVRIARRDGNEEDQVQTIESFDARNPFQTRQLIALARTWRHARATLRGLTAAANDLTYRHGEFRQAMRLWHEILELAERVEAVPWQANALNQITLLHITLGEFEPAVVSKYRADEADARLGPTAEPEVLLMERDFALTRYLDGDWPSLASYWLDFAGNPPQGLETQLAVPLYAAMAASAAAAAGTDRERALHLVDALAGIVTIPGVQQVNGVVAFAADAIVRLGASDRAATWDRFAKALIEAGLGDYPQTSLALTRARLLTLQGDQDAHRWFERARETLALQGQAPLLAIAMLEQALAPTTSLANRKRLLKRAADQFATLQMTSWHQKSQEAATLETEGHPDLAGLSRRELEVIQLLAQGQSDRRIADALYISERTVNAHVRNILRKTGSGNRTGLTIWARETGILGV